MFDVADPSGSDIKSDPPRPGGFDGDFDVVLLCLNVKFDAQGLMSEDAFVSGDPKTPGSEK